ncbi:sorting and assembly machinery component 50 homolog [Hydra vulgaris]|uniref:Sorting and assembly machinery component 50 homolog n=1 Tax=Hydra vulgaris TaxID=6087 RepID=A0ABM4BHC8_HYDVU
MGGSYVKPIYAADASQFIIQAEETDIDENDIPLKVPAVIKNIFIDGLCKTKNVLIANQLSDMFKAKTFSDIMTEAHLGKLKLERLGIFSSIDVLVDVSEDSHGDVFDVHYIVKEKRRFSMNIGTSIGANEGGMTMNANINNIRGYGETLKSGLSFGTRVSSAYEFAYIKPFSNDSDKKFTIRLIKSMEDKSQSLYNENTKGAGFDFQIPSALGVHVFGLDFMCRENLINLEAPFSVRENAGHSLKSSIKHTLTSDGRDDWIFPSSGHLVKHSVEYSGIGGNVKSIKSDLELQINKEIIPNVVVSCSFQGGVVRSLTSDLLLINDRLFLGGPVSIRGFATRGIGRHDGQASLGGEKYWASGLHLYTPLPFRPGQGGFGDLFRLHLFFNAGSLSDFNTSFRDFISKPRYSYGLGVMIMLGAVARLEINYCIPKNAQPGDVINNGLQVGVGMSFL